MTAILPIGTGTEAAIATAMTPPGRRGVSKDRRPDSHMLREQNWNGEKIAEREREKEQEAIKEQYLGSKKPKKRVIKPPSEKFRFSFDWENTISCHPQLMEIRRRLRVLVLLSCHLLVSLLSRLRMRL